MRSANSGLWRSVTGRGSHPTGSVTGCATRHEAQHSPRLRLAPPCSQPRSRPGVAELGVVRRCYAGPVIEVMKAALSAFVLLTLGLSVRSAPSSDEFLADRRWVAS